MKNSSLTVYGLLIKEYDRGRNKEVKYEGFYSTKEKAQNRLAFLSPLHIEYDINRNDNKYYYGISRYYILNYINTPTEQNKKYMIDNIGPRMYIIEHNISPSDDIFTIMGFVTSDKDLCQNITDSLHIYSRCKNYKMDQSDEKYTKQVSEIINELWKEYINDGQDHIISKESNDILNTYSITYS